MAKKYISKNINNKNTLTEYIENYLMRNKDIIITLIEFIKFKKNIYYKNNLDKKFHINDKHFKNLYYKIKKI